MDSCHVGLADRSTTYLTRATIDKNISGRMLSGNTKVLSYALTPYTYPHFLF